MTTPKVTSNTPLDNKSYNKELLGKVSTIIPLDNVPTTGNIELKSTKDYIRPTIITNTNGNSKLTNKIGHKKQSNLGAWLNIREPTTTTWTKPSRRHIKCCQRTLSMGLNNKQHSGGRMLQKETRREK